MAKQQLSNLTVSKNIIENQISLQNTTKQVELTSIPTDTQVTSFGTITNPIAVYPNDVVQLDIYNAAQAYLESNYRIATTTREGNVVTLSPELDLSDLGYISGKYTINYRFLRNYLGSGDAHKLQIQEISANRLEIRVVPAFSSQFDNSDYLAMFESGFFQLPKSQVLPNLFLNRDANTSLRVFDYVQDKFTFSVTPYSIIFKLNAPATTDIVVGDFLWLNQQVSDTISDSITIVPPKLKNNGIRIAGPNFDVLAKQHNNASTQFKSWDDLLTTNTQTSLDIANKLLSGSLLEGIPLNIDYRSFENYNNFGSATERLMNLKYKVQLLEGYNGRIQALTTDLDGLPDSSTTGSVYVLINVADAKAKRDALIGTFDGYENYVYYQSSSFVSNSYGEFYPTTWPKSNSTKPYTNYSYTASQFDDWYDGIITSASLFDQNNDNSLYKILPAHIAEDDNNQGFLLFANMIGHYFDLTYSYIKQISLTHNRDQSLLDGFSKDLVYHVSKNLGIDFENGNSLEDLWSYTLGANATGSLTSIYGTSAEDKTKETWKRIINNLPYLLKTKGTERGVRALINCFGIPQTILRVREYGGSEPEFDSKTDLVYDRFFYDTTVGYNGKTSGQVAQLIEAPWKPLAVNNLMPSTIELRVKMAKNQTKTQTLFEVPNKWQVKAFQSASNGYIGFFLSGSSGWATASVTSSIYDSTYHHIALERSVASDISSSNQTYKLIVKKANYLKTTLTTSASLDIDGASSSSYNIAYTSTGSLWIPGSGSFLAATSHSMNILSGSVQELRFWTTPLQDAILDNHTLAPTSFQGNLADTYTGSTSSFSTLGFRLCLGTDNKKINLVTTSSISSQHPDQTKSGLSGSFYNFSGSYFNPLTEIHSLEWPDLGGNRSVSNKIRIDGTATAGDNQLYRNTSVIRAISDNNPIDSSRVGVYFSPTNEINQDIAEQFGGLSIDEFIGDPSYLGLDNYPGLVALQNEYYKKYNRRSNPQNYIRLLKHYDAALFQLIKKFIPYRANAQVGLVIESDLLQRSKIAIKTPTFENLLHTSSIDAQYNIITGGNIEDGGGDFNRSMANYVDSGIITKPDGSDFIVLSGNEQYMHELAIINDSSIFQPLTLAGACNEFNNGGVDDQPSGTDSLIGDIDTAVTAYGRNMKEYGSQYVFMSYAMSGSNAGQTITRITSSRYDYHDPINPTIMDSKRSEISNESGYKYDVDIYGGRAFIDSTAYSADGTVLNTIYSSSAAIYENKWTSIYGLNIVSTILNSASFGAPLTLDPVFNANSYWFLKTSPDQLGLGFYSDITGSTSACTSSVKLPAFFYKADDPSTWNYIYEIKIVCEEDVSTTNYIELHYGDLDCGLTGSLIPTTTSINVNTIITRAKGPWLGIRLYQITTAGVEVYIPKLSVTCLNYKSQTQDYHLQDSYGMRNARYDGCKLTSADFNVNSPDTIDGGPVIQVTVGGGKQLGVKPSTKGNFEVR